MVRVYTTEEVRIGKGIVGWNTKEHELVKTTPVVETRMEPGVGQVVKTQEGGEYAIVNRR